MSRNMFAAWNPLPEQTSYELDLMTSDSLKQQDDNDMQAYFDAMEPMAIPMPLARVEETTASDPFGQDFDEEFVVDAADVLRWQQRQQQRDKQSSVATQSTSAAANASIKVTSEAMAEEPVYQEMLPVESLVVQPQYEAGYSDVITMTTTGAVDQRLQQEIEDLISQLNFSAFSVEMDSVEQISPEFLRQAASAAQFEQLSDSHDYPDTLPLHRPDTASTAGPLSMDDDRDLLIIEEEVPASVKHQSVPVSAPAVGTMSYPQLFQQLRS